MELKKYFDYILENYLLPENLVFSKDMKYFQVICNYIPEELKKYYDVEKYNISGSCGKGGKSSSPYISIKNVNITNTTQKGIYVDYIFKSDMTGFYLTLDQGITWLKKAYGNKKATEIANKAAEMFRNMITNENNFEEGLVSSTTKAGTREEGYEKTRIIAKYYDKNNYSDEELLHDLEQMISIYEEIYNKMNGKTYEELVLEIAENKKDDKLSELISDYKNNLDKYLDEEVYKWEYIKSFQDNWIDNCDINNFTNMLKNSLKDSANILTASNYYPKGMICIYAELEPETVKNMFTELFDENNNLYQRIKSFRDKADELLAKYPDRGKNHFQDMHTISSYLSARYPDKYYLYKATVDKKAFKTLDIEINDSDKINELIKFFKECEKVNNEILKDSELKELVGNYLNDKCYKNDNSHILTYDFLHYVGKVYSEKNDVTEFNNNENIVWLYAPGENAEFWNECIEKNQMYIGWDELGDLRKYSSYDEIYYALQNVYNHKNPINMKCACGDFVYKVKPGDIIIAKTGKHKLLGYGTVTSNYRYEEDRAKGKHVIDVNWIKIGEWINNTGTSNVQKTLTDISQYPGYPEQLLAIIKGEKIMNKIIIEWIIPANSNYYNHVGAFDKFGYIDWKQRANYNVGDIVYLYLTVPESRIGVKTIVEKIDINNEDKTDDSEFTISNDFEENYGRYVRLRLIEYISEKELEFNELRKHGLKGSIQGPMKLSGELQEYIHDILNGTISEELLSQNIIYYGGPGCGKSFLVNEKYCKDNPLNIRTTFYPDYTNSDFIGQLIPKYDKQKEKLIYDIQAGPFTKALELALKYPRKNVYLIVEEINRGNASAIFGDVFQLLDRNDDGRSTYQISNYVIEQYINDNTNIDITNNVYIPENLSIIATMNTSDQNVYTLDSAFKRRWKMKHISNKFNEDETSKDYDKKLGGLNVPIKKKDINWKTFIDKINKAIIEENTFGINSEDKQIGKYFVGSDDLISHEVYETDNFEEAARMFAEKVLMYIWEDISKIEPATWFREDIKTFDKLLDVYISDGIDVFSENIKLRLGSELTDESEE